MFSRIKTIILTVLIMITVYQMFELWFDDYSNRNFFYSAVTNIYEKNSTGIDYKYVFEPERIVVSFGKFKYTVIKNNDVEIKKLQVELKKIFSKIVDSAKDVNEEKMDMKEFLDNKAILFEYPIQMINITNINNDYAENEKIAKQIGGFNKVIVRASNQGEEMVDCFFIDEKTKIMKTVKIPYNSKSISDSINSIQNKAKLNVYSATEYVAIKKYFSTINFLPEFNREDIYINQKIIVKNPFVIDNVLDENKVEEYINRFFENPSAKWNFKKQDGVIVYADGEKSIKYYDTGMIEYFNSKATAKDSYLNFGAAYQIVMAFMEKDSKYMYENLYLAHVEKTNDSEWVLGFEFKIDDYRYIMAKNLGNATNMKYPIEIVVKNNHVYSYKRILREFEAIPNFETIKLRSYGEVLDIVLNSKENKEEILIKDMFISYYAQDLKSNPTLTWIVETNNKIYAIDAVKETE